MKTHKKVLKRKITTKNIDKNSIQNEKEIQFEASETEVKYFLI